MFLPFRGTNGSSSWPGSPPRAGAMPRGDSGGTFSVPPGWPGGPGSPASSSIVIVLISRPGLVEAEPTTDLTVGSRRLTHSRVWGEGRDFQVGGRHKSSAGGGPHSGGDQVGRGALDGAVFPRMQAPGKLPASSRQAPGKLPAILTGDGHMLAHPCRPSVHCRGTVPPPPPGPYPRGPDAMAGWE
jgi:hypothetical protein